MAALGTETNTFSPIPTGWTAFKEDLWHRSGASLSSHHWFSGPLRIWRSAAETLGFEVKESIAAFAQPAGLTRQDVWEELRNMILSDATGSGSFDIVLLQLHGAMVSDEEPDCEGDLLHRLRKITGPDTIIGVELDLHCHLSSKLIEAADVVITYKEYPHVDVNDRATELFDLCLATANKEIRPVTAVADCHMLSVWRTPLEPTRGFVDQLHSLEGQNNVLSLSFVHGFPWADVPDVGAKVIVVTDDDLGKAQELAHDLAEKIWAMRADNNMRLLTVDEAASLACNPGDGLTVLADVSDNAGAGAASDSTYLLEALLESSVTRCLVGCFWDPVSVRLCQEIGEGGRISLRIGGKVGPMSGEPVDVTAKVLKIVLGATQTFGRGQQNMGDAVLLEVEGLHVVLISFRTQTFHPDAYTQFGIALRDYNTVFVKSAQHFSAGFAPVADNIHYVAADGTANPDFTNLRFKNVERALWPLVDNPF